MPAQRSPLHTSDCDRFSTNGMPTPCYPACQFLAQHLPCLARCAGTAQPSVMLEQELIHPGDALLPDTAQPFGSFCARQRPAHGIRRPQRQPQSCEPAGCPVGQLRPAPVLTAAPPRTWRAHAARMLLGAQPFRAFAYPYPICCPAGKAACNATYSNAWPTDTNTGLPQAAELAPCCRLPPVNQGPLAVPNGNEVCVPASALQANLPAGLSLGNEPLDPSYYFVACKRGEGERQTTGKLTANLPGVYLVKKSRVCGRCACQLPSGCCCDREPRCLCVCCRRTAACLLLPAQASACAGKATAGSAWTTMATLPACCSRPTSTRLWALSTSIRAPRVSFWGQCTGCLTMACSAMACSAMHAQAGEALEDKSNDTRPLGNGWRTGQLCSTALFAGSPACLPPTCCPPAGCRNGWKDCNGQANDGCGRAATPGRAATAMRCCRSATACLQLFSASPPRPKVCRLRI